MFSPTDPAEWSKASETPDIAGGIDTLEDLLLEVASDRLATMRIRAEDRDKIAPTIVAVAMDGIKQAQERGLLHDQDGATWTPKFLEIVAHIVSDLLDAKNTRLMVQCFDFAAGLGLQLGVSEQQIADEHGMSRSNVSKICVSLTERYSLPPSRSMRSISTRKNYSVRQLGRRAKPTPEEWNRTKRLSETILLALSPYAQPA